MDNFDIKNLSYEELLQINKTVEEFIKYLESENETITNDE